jgi:dCTP diphosphatase
MVVKAHRSAHEDNPKDYSIMNDDKTTVDELKGIVDRFVSERQWEQFHKPKNLAMSIAIEAAELMEHFQWIGSDQPIEQVDNDSPIAQEIADVLAYTLRIATVLGVDLSQALELKMVRNRLKYPLPLAGKT